MRKCERPTDAAAARCEEITTKKKEAPAANGCSTHKEITFMIPTPGWLRPEMGTVDREYIQWHRATGSDQFAEHYPHMNFGVCYRHTLATINKGNESSEDALRLATAMACEEFHTGFTAFWDHLVYEQTRCYLTAFEDAPWESEASRLARKKLKALNDIRITAEIHHAWSVPPEYEESHRLRIGFWRWWTRVIAATEELDMLASPEAVRFQYRHASELFRQMASLLPDWKVKHLREAWAAGEGA